MNEQPLDLRTSLQEIWRRRLLVIVVAALCGLGGLVYGFLKPANETASALVLLPASTASGSSSSGNSGNSGAVGSGINTQAVIARSTPVLTAAGAKVSPPLGPSAVQELVTVTPLSSQILQIQAQGPNSRNAVQLANALATSYVDYIGQLETSSAGPGVADLKKESATFTKQIKDLQTQINTVTSRITSEGAGSSAGERDVVLLGSLQGQQDQVSLQLNTVTSQIASAQAANGSTAEHNADISEGYCPTGIRVRPTFRSGHHRIRGRALGSCNFRNHSTPTRASIATSRRDRPCSGSPGHRFARCTELHQFLCMARAPRKPTARHQRVGPSPRTPLSSE